MTWIIILLQINSTCSNKDLTFCISYSFPIDYIVHMGSQRCTINFFDEFIFRPVYESANYYFYSILHVYIDHSTVKRVYPIINNTLNCSALSSLRHDSYLSTMELVTKEINPHNQETTLALSGMFKRVLRVKSCILFTLIQQLTLYYKIIHHLQIVAAKLGFIKVLHSYIWSCLFFIA